MKKVWDFIWTRFYPVMASTESQEEKCVQVEVDPNTTYPTKAWQKLRVKQTKQKVEPVDPNTPIQEDKVRFVCLSDTHTKIETCLGMVPPGDVLLHAGDFTNIGRAKEVFRFNEFLGNLPHKYKVIIAGNHDMSFDDDMVKSDRERLRLQFGLTSSHLEDFLEKKNVTSVKEFLTNCIYLEDTTVDIYGIKIHGSPWQPAFCDWGFNLPRGEKCLEKWRKIPANTDILITHGPPVGHGDYCFDGRNAGCVDLLNTIQKRVKPKYHVFGHIHEGYGVTTDGFTTYINASNCTLKYKCTNPAIVFDLPLPDGHSKQEVMDIIPYVSSVVTATDSASTNNLEIKETDGLVTAFE